ncbi:MAG TPA: hypothetical protein VLN49_04325 [Gemmatimonadaceae bacterium]|nr:hypothetical protein [Gemmatimonadaceae bacterium]
MRIRTSMLFAALATFTARASAQWTPQASPTTAEFRGLSVVSPTVAWASGTHGRVVQTTDGGRTWALDSVAAAGSFDLRAIVARSATQAWAITSGPAEQGQAHVFHTDDGRQWTSQFETTRQGVFLDAMAFWDDLHGIALSDPVGGKPFVIVTDDGGKSWTQVPTDDAPAILPNEASFAASGTCLTIQGGSTVWFATGGGARARVFRSSDRGRTWSVADAPVHAGNQSSGLFSIAFSDSLHGVAVGGDYAKPKEPLDNVAVTSDGGRTWRLAKGPLPAGFMSAVAYIPGTGGRSLVAVGLAGTARSADGGETWTMIDTVAYNSVAFASRDVGWAVGPQGRIARWTPTPRVQKP